MIMHTLGLKKEDINRMDLYEYLSAVNFAMTTYKLKVPPIPKDKEKDKMKIRFSEIK